MSVHVYQIKLNLTMQLIDFLFIYRESLSIYLLYFYLFLLFSNSSETILNFLDESTMAELGVYPWGAKLKCNN